MNTGAEWWSIESRRWLWLAIILFIGLEFILRLKFGSIFTLAFAWLFVHQWLVKKTLAQQLSENPLEKIFISLYYAFIITFAGFMVFCVLNAIIRTINNDWRFFQPL
jgi:hypothetical protein